MKNSLVLILFLTIYYCSAQTLAKDFSLTDTNNNTYTLFDELNQGKTVVLDFFGYTCGTCQSHVPMLDSMWQIFQDDNVWIWGIESLNFNNEMVVDFMNNYGATYPCFSTFENDTVLDLYGISYTPYYLVVCPDKKAKYTTIYNIPAVVSGCNTLGNNNMFHQPIIDVYQNQITINTQNKIYSLTICNIYGQILSQQIINSKTTLDLSIFKKGMYIVNLVAYDYFISKKIFLH
ncbi:MAG TPA: hypothetical protein DDX39_00455 [Bacteroidales bacterium]|nr:MAG: hypothetical protein A2W98_03100 [Bacteroidetes bacterium GWF2_33_38]OFY75239.1 MAG: hypothetical protein A2265_05495 [Bacteroidetes bacterium RIFOXYA12_FULL_33_9]HBF87081.1 hypothetical protein [Bacteroidales bacterium]